MTLSSVEIYGSVACIVTYIGGYELELVSQENTMTFFRLGRINLCISQSFVILSDGDGFYYKLLKLIVSGVFPTKCFTTPHASGRVNLFDFLFYLPSLPSTVKVLMSH